MRNFLFSVFSPQRLLRLKHLFCKTSNSTVTTSNKTGPQSPVTYKHLDNVSAVVEYSQVSPAGHSIIH